MIGLFGTHWTAISAGSTLGIHSRPFQPHPAMKLLVTQLSNHSLRSSVYSKFHRCLKLSNNQVYYIWIYKVAFWCHDLTWLWILYLFSLLTFTLSQPQICSLKSIDLNSKTMPLLNSIAYSPFHCCNTYKLYYLYEHVDKYMPINRTLLAILKLLSIITLLW